jgi:hypothetical protein
MGFLDHQRSRVDRRRPCELHDLLGNPAAHGRPRPSQVQREP